MQRAIWLGCGWVLLRRSRFKHIISMGPDLDNNALFTHVNIVVQCDCTLTSPLQRYKVSYNHVLLLKRKRVCEHYRLLMIFLLCHPLLNILHIVALLSKVIHFSNITRKFQFVPIILPWGSTFDSFVVVSPYLEFLFLFLFFLFIPCV